MKKFTGVLLYFMISAQLIYTTQHIYIENHFGQKIIYKLASAHVNAPAYGIENQERVDIGPLKNVTYLSIRTYRIGSNYLASFFDLKDILHDINMQASLHPTQNAIILVKPSGMFSQWNISIHWESINTELIEIGLTLEDILEGSLGNDYAQKVHAISHYDYTKATKGGFINLKNELLKEIDNTNKNTYKKTSRRKGTWVSPDVSTTEDLKDSINRLYNALQKYKIRDNQ